MYKLAFLAIKKMSNSISGALVYPTLVRRLQAMVVDFIIILVLFSVISIGIGEMGAVPTWFKVSVFIGLICLYEPVLVAFNGGTLGHKLLGIRIINIDEPQQNISFIKAIIRILIKTALGWVSFLTVTSNPQKRAIHDLASDSLVIIR